MALTLRQLNLIHKKRGHKVVFFKFNNPIIYKFLKDFTNHRKKTNRAVVFAMYLSPIFLNTGTTDETLQQSGKQNVSTLKLKSSPTMYESSGSQF